MTDKAGRNHATETAAMVGSQDGVRSYSTTSHKLDTNQNEEKKRTTTNELVEYNNIVTSVYKSTSLPCCNFKY